MDYSGAPQRGYHGKQSLARLARPFAHTTRSQRFYRGTPRVPISLRTFLACPSTLSLEPYSCLGLIWDTSQPANLTFWVCRGSPPYWSSATGSRTQLWASSRLQASWRGHFANPSPIPIWAAPIRVGLPCFLLPHRDLEGVSLSLGLSGHPKGAPERNRLTSTQPPITRVIPPTVWGARAPLITL
jgi:hypothetical protein